jgi:hypothetical protein
METQISVGVPDFSQMGSVENWLPDPNYVSPEEIEFRRKLENPFHLFQKGDYWVASEVFCLGCGNKSHPFIFDKILVDTIEKTERRTVPVKVGNKYIEYPSKELKYKEFKYCDVLRCDNGACKEFFFRTFTIKENAVIPNDEPRLIPERKDKVPIKNESEDVAFEKAYGRYVEAVMAYNMGLNYGSGASIRSVLEILCKQRGHFDTILNAKIGGRTLTTVQLDSLNRQVGLETQMDLLIPEIQKVARRKFGSKLLKNIKAMMYWGHGVVHGSTEPSEKEIKSGLEILEEFFRILYFDIIEIQKKKIRRVKLTQNTEDFKGYRRR